MLHTTFNILREHGACKEGYDRLARCLGSVKKYGADTPIPLITILESNGLDDTLWCLRAVLPEEEVKRDREARLLACDYTEHVLHIYEKHHPGDQRPRRTIEMARRYANGEATDEELMAAAAWVTVWETMWAAAAWATAAEAAVRATAAAAVERDWQAHKLQAMLEGTTGD